MNCQVEVECIIIPFLGPIDRPKANLLKGSGLLKGSEGVTPKYIFSVSLKLVHFKRNFIVFFCIIDFISCISYNLLIYKAYIAHM